MTGAIFRERPNTKTLLQKSVGDTPAKCLFHTGRRFLRLPAGGALFPPIGENEKKRFLVAHLTVFFFFYSLLSV